MQAHPTPETSPPGRLASINRSHGGVPKLPVHEARITESGIEGDRQRDLSIHGGPDRAVLIYSMNLIQALAHEGHPIRPGAAGENLTLEGIDWSRVVPGVEIVIGEMDGTPAATASDSAGGHAPGPVRLQVTTYASPCSNIKGSFADGNSARISSARHPGWSRVYARVITGGNVQVGDRVVLQDSH